MVRRVSLGMLASLVSCIAAACTSAPQRAPEPDGRHERADASSEDSKQAAALVLHVLAMNDLHGQLEAIPLFAGAVSNLERSLGNAHAGVLTFDAGDMFQGTLASNETEGAAVIAAYNALPLTAAALGNHEFDFGPVGSSGAAGERGAKDVQGALKARIREARFPMLSVNLIDRASRAPVHWSGLERSVQIDVAGVPVGIIGALTEETPKIVLKAFFEGLDVAPLAETIQREATMLRSQGARVVIAIVHAGAACKELPADAHDVSSCDDGEVLRLARALPPGSVELIVAGHTHTALAHKVHGIGIVQAYAQGRAFARADIHLKEGRVKQVDVFAPHVFCHAGRAPDCGEYAGAAIVPDARIAETIRPALELAERRRRKPLGVMVKEKIWADRTRESPLGNLFVDLMRKHLAGADVALTNGGSLRNDLPEGALTYGDLYEAMPFDNRLATLTLEARELTEVLERHLSHAEHGIVSISGLLVRARCADRQLSVDLYRADGRKVLPSQTLTIVTSDYLATGGDDFFDQAVLSRVGARLDIETVVRDALAEQLEKRGGTLSAKDNAIFDPKRPRLVMPGPRPIRCGVR